MVKRSNLFSKQLRGSNVLYCIHGRCFICFRWFGKCWHIQNLLKYEFEIEFDVSKRKTIVPPDMLSAKECAELGVQYSGTSSLTVIFTNLILE